VTAVAQPQEKAPYTGSPRPRADSLGLADGVELVGRYKGSGFEKPPLLARRADGQMVQLTKPLYAIAALADGQRDAGAIAAILTQASNRTFTGADVQRLVDSRLRPVGVLAHADGSSPVVPKREALMALQHRRPVLSERAVNVLARPFTVLHRPLVTVAMVLGLIVFDVWLFGFHGIAPGLRSVIYNPMLLLAVVGAVVLATAFHEIGHASACRYSGGRPGVMGVGWYLVYPAFYCDVTDAYRLERSGRLRTDLGGVYFNGIFALLAGAVYFGTGEEAALFTAAVMHLVMLQQLLPLMRFDGYYVLTDLTGVPDILSRIKPIFRSLVRGRRNEPRVAELKPWVRVVVTAYLVTLVPALLFLFLWMVMGAPRVLATVHDSLGLQLEGFRAAEGFAERGAAVVGILALVLPVAGMALSLTRVGRLCGRGLARWSSRSPARRVVAVVAGAAAVAAVGYVWWPNGDYEPIRPGERGILAEVVEGLPDLGEGRALAVPKDPGGEPHVHPGSGSGTDSVGADETPTRPRDARERTERRGGPDAATVVPEDSASPGSATAETSGVEPEAAVTSEPPEASDPATTASPSPEPSAAPTTSETPTDTSSPSPDTGSTSPETGSTSPETGTSSDTATTSSDTGTLDPATADSTTG
jgi:putative peptide zinc metalloprotease protein